MKKLLRILDVTSVISYMGTGILVVFHWGGAMHDNVFHGLVLIGIGSIKIANAGEITR